MMNQDEVVMEAIAREKFSSQASPELLRAARQLAQSQGRQFQAVIDDALREYLERQLHQRPRPAVAQAFAASLKEFDALYAELAK